MGLVQPTIPAFVTQKRSQKQRSDHLGVSIIVFFNFGLRSWSVLEAHLPQYHYVQTKSVRINRGLGKVVMSL